VTLVLHFTHFFKNCLRIKSIIFSQRRYVFSKVLGVFLLVWLAFCLFFFFVYFLGFGVFLREGKKMKEENVSVWLLILFNKKIL